MPSLYGNRSKPMPPYTASEEEWEAYRYCVRNNISRLLAQTSLRNILGTKNLHEILSDRESIAQAMQVREGLVVV